jgi:hypothetical protein
VALSNRWLRSGAFALVAARRRAISATKLPDPTGPRRRTRGLCAGAIAAAGRAVDLDTHRGMPIRSLFGADPRTGMFHGASLGSRQ